jgi:glycosyltransferase involved in cell wall biosynthesis
VKRVAVVPAHNEQSTITDVLESTNPYVDLIIVIDDGSTDASSDRIAHWVNDHNNTYYLGTKQCRGVARATGMGFCLVCYLMALGIISAEDLIINIDADGQHDPEDIAKLVGRLLGDDCDLALGRRDFSVYPAHKVLGNRLLSLSASLLTGLRYTDVECGYRALRARIVPDIIQYYTGCRYSCCQELGVISALLGFKIDNECNIQIKHYRSRTHLRDLFLNSFLGFVSLLRVKLNMKSDMDRKVRQALKQLRSESKDIGSVAGGQRMSTNDSGLSPGASGQ